MRLTSTQVLTLERAGRLPTGTVARAYGHDPAPVDRPPRQSGGRRADLNGLYVRSSWEANAVRWAQDLERRGLIWGWAYEPVEFWFHAIARGIRQYIPDLLIWAAGGHQWLEVKGHLDAPSKTKLKRFQRYYPEEHERLRVLDHNWFYQMEKSGAAGLLPGWEPLRKDPR